jgi:hypothetical protein
LPILAVVTPIDSFRKQLLLQTLTKFFPATGDQTFTLNNFLVEKSTADAILILLPALVLRLLPFSLL